MMALTTTSTIAVHASRRLSVPLAIAWDIWLRGRRGLVYPVCVLVAALVIMYRSVTSNDRPWTPSASAWAHFWFVTLAAIGLIGGVSVAIGSAGRYYPRPVASFAIALWFLLFAMLQVVCLYVTIAAGFNWVTDSDWPLFAPAIFLAACTATIQAMLRATAQRGVLRVVACVLAASVLQLWFMVRYALQDADFLWRNVSASEWGQLLTLIAIGFAASLVAIRLDRSGRLSGGVGSLQRILASAAGWRAVFGRVPKDALAAQFWKERREKGYVGPVLLAGYLCLLLWFDWSRGARFSSRTVAAGSFMIWATFFFAPSFGKCGGTWRDPACGSFFATRPLSDRALAYAMLKHAFASCIIACGLWMLACASAIAMVQLYPSWHSIDIRLWSLSHYLPQQNWWLRWPLVAALTVGAMWTIIGFIAPLFMAGRGLLIAIVTGVATVLLILYVWATSQWEATNEHRAIFWLELAIVGSLALAILATFVVAMRKQLIGWRQCTAAFGLWMCIAALLVVIIHAGLTLDWGLPFFKSNWLNYFIPFVAVLPLFPLAAAPLAIHWNRHR
jgi:hypothetical protein